MKQITIVLAIEQFALRHKLRSLLEGELDIQIAGEVNNGMDALDMVGMLDPDILLFGLNSSNKLEIIQLVNLRNPKTAIVITCENGNENKAKELLASGVKACLLKKTTANELAKAIRLVNESKNALGVTSFETAAKNDNQQRDEFILDPIETLTSREREVFDLVVKGLTTSQIAARLSISSRTVEMHRVKIMRKLGFRNQHQQLLDYATERGI